MHIIVVIGLMSGCLTEPAPVDDLEARRAALSQEVRGMVGELEAAGRYDYCVEVSCKQCALRVGGCRCGEGLRNGEPVCEECALMWRRGKGAEAGVDPASVRSFLEAEREMQSKAAGAQCSCSEEHPPTTTSPVPSPPVPSPP